MPKHPHILKLDGRYYYRRRIPSDLVEAGCYGKAKDIKRALKTGDLAAANRFALTVALQVDEEFRARRRELGLARPVENCFKNGKTRRLADLPELERRDFIMRIFITKAGEEQRRWEASDPDNRKEMLQILGEDRSALEAELSEEQFNWLGALRRALEAEGISMEGTDSALVLDLARKLQRAHVETLWRAERAATGHPHESRDQLFKGSHADSELPAPTKQFKTVGDLCDAYIAHKLNRVEGGHIARSSIPKFKMHIQIMTDFFGAGKSLGTINGEDAVRMVAFLSTIPQNATKRYPSISLVAAAERENERKSKRLLHPSTVQDYHAALSAMISHAVELEWIKDNPFRGRLVVENLPKAISKDREVLTPEEMTKVFAADEFLSHRHEGRDTIQARFWVPLLCLFQGTRSNEVAGMHVADVEATAGIAFLNLRESTEHRLKNKSSVRRVPVHQMLIDLGFLEFVAKRQKEDPDGYLFTGLSRNKNGSMSDAVGKWWQRTVKRIVGASPADGPNGGRGLHSLRHSWVAAARTAGLDESIRKRLGGWSQDGAANDYGWAGALPVLKTSIDRIVFPGVKFPPVLKRIKRG